METINLPISGCFESKYLEIAEKFEKAGSTGGQFVLNLFSSGFVSTDSVLAFYEICRTRPQSVGLHIHSHISLTCSEVLIWLAGSTRSLRTDAWIHFVEYPRNRLGRSDYQQFRDSLEGYEPSQCFSPFQENYLQVERLVKRHLPHHLLNRRVWRAELEEWHIIKAASNVASPGSDAASIEQISSEPESEKTTDKTPKKISN